MLRYDQGLVSKFMIGPVCRLCDGEGVIYRKTKKVIKPVTRNVYVEGKIESFEEENQSLIGGIDLCPECVARAESEYRSIKHGR